MLSFKQFIVERVYRLSGIEQQSINKIVDFYMNLFDPKRLQMPIAKIISLGPERVYKKFINDKGFITIGILEFHDDEDNVDKKIPVYVGFDKKSADKGTYIYDSDANEEYIILHYYKLKYDRAFIKDALIHEVNHAKQPYKNVGKHYERSKLDYYTDPVEVHNYVTNIIQAIEDEYVDADTAEKRHKIITELEEFVRSGQVPDNELGDKIERIGKHEFIEILYSNKDNPKVAKAYHKFINKLTWLLDSLKEYENR
jgi:hypothetical protein